MSFRTMKLIFLIAQRRVERRDRKALVLPNNNFAGPDFRVVRRRRPVQVARRGREAAGQRAVPVDHLPAEHRHARGGVSEQLLE